MTNQLPNQSSEPKLTLEEEKDFEKIIGSLHCDICCEESNYQESGPHSCAGVAARNFIIRLLSNREQKARREEREKWLERLGEAEAKNFQAGFKEGRQKENKAWLEGRRCRSCGKDIGALLADTCNKCFEEENKAWEE